MMKEMIRKVMEWCKLWNGETATAKQAGPSSDKREKEQAADNREVQDRLENYLWKHYEFRFNVLTEQPEYCAKGQGTDTPYKIVTQRTLNTLCLEAHRHRINCWDKDVSRLLHSERLEDYHPFLYGCTAPMGRSGPYHSAGAAHLEENFLDKRLPPLDAGNGRPVVRTHGPLRQCSGPYVGEPYAGQV